MTLPGITPLITIIPTMVHTAGNILYASKLKTIPHTQENKPKINHDDRHPSSSTVNK